MTCVKRSGATRGEGNGTPEIFSFLGAPTGIGALRVKGPRKVAPNKVKNR